MKKNITVLTVILFFVSLLAVKQEVAPLITEMVQSAKGDKFYAFYCFFGFGIVVAIIGFNWHFSRVLSEKILNNIN